MEYIYSNELPQSIIYFGQKIQLQYNVRELNEAEIRNLFEREGVEDEYFDAFYDSHRYSYNSVLIGALQWTRDGIINAIIRDKYRQDEMEAITNNMAAINAVFMQTLVSDGIVAATKYLKDSINDDNTARFKEMQEWRAMAKKVASEIIKE